MTRPATRATTIVLLVAAMALEGCSGWSDSSVNPSNWFGRSRPAEVSPEEFATEVNPLLPDSAEDFIAGNEAAVQGVTIDQVTSLVIERTVEGAIIRAEGLAARQGAYDARLIPDTFDETPIDGVLSYRFVVKYPVEPTVQGPAATRTVSVARTVSSQILGSARVIRVSGSQNARESGRR
ncbi:MAG: hypothetical protein CML68_24075 [Rhodobacteraceae bacterium]|nr:hypothetical protein [Paracoccaceae bacterium]